MAMMQEKWNAGQIIVGVFPIRRDILSRQEALIQKERILSVLAGILPDTVRFVNVDDVVDDGVASDITCCGPAIEKFRRYRIDALFIPFCDFGCERAAAEICKAFDVPVLLFGARDEVPNTDLGRGRDTQCGMFAATKVLMRYGITYSYIVQCRAEDPALKAGLVSFLRVASVLKSLKNLKILKIGERPGPFVSVATDEGVLMTKFGIECVPASPNAIGIAAEGIYSAHDRAFEDGFSEWLSRVDASAMDPETVRKLYALKLAIARSMEENGCRTAAIECWPTMRAVIGGFSICPCLGELADMGLPVACETDVNGAVVLEMLAACNFYREPGFLADLTMRHPENDNAELLWHCGPFPYSLRHPNSRPYLKNAKERWELKPGDLTLVRLDDHLGRYSLFCGQGHTTAGPETTGTYAWVEVEDWKKWEEALIFGPYIHHIGGMYGHHLPVFREVARYLGVAFDTPESAETRSL